MTRLIDADSIPWDIEGVGTIPVVTNEEIDNMPTVDAQPVVRCKDCKHRPKRTGDEGNGFDFEFPDERCPCQCEDGWYNRMPKGDWFCGNGERKEDGNN